MVSACQNDTYTLTQTTDTHKIDDIDTLINDSQDNGVINLDNEYTLQSNETLKINKSVTINGDANKTIIDGNNYSLYLDTIDKEKIDISEHIIIMPLDNDLKNNGKHIVFNNITFKNIKLHTWHEMEFNDCDFIDSTFTSHELNNRFNNCIFNNSMMELTVLKGYYHEKVPAISSEIMNCQFFESEIKTKSKYSPYYITIVGGDFFRIYDNANMLNCNLSKSKVSIDNIIINITQCIFNNTNITGHSNSINISDSEFTNQKIDLTICKTIYEGSKFNNSNIKLSASYFSMGTQTSMKNCSLNNTNIKISPCFRSRPSTINLIDSETENSIIDSTDAVVTIKNSILNKTEMLLFFTALRINDTLIFNNDTLNNTIKTKLSEVKNVWINNTSTNMTINYQIKTDYQISNTYFVNNTGKYRLTGEDISKNTLYNFTLIRQDVYYINDELIFELKDLDNNPVVSEEIYIEINNNYPIPSVKTDENGIAKYKLNEIGNLEIEDYYYSYGLEFRSLHHALTLNIFSNPIVDDLKISKVDFKTNIYSTIDSYLKLKLISKSHDSILNTKIIIKITGKKTKKIFRLTAKMMVKTILIYRPNYLQEHIKSKSLFQTLIL